MILYDERALLLIQRTTSNVKDIDFTLMCQNREKIIRWYERFMHGYRCINRERCDCGLRNKSRDTIGLDSADLTSRPPADFAWVRDFLAARESFINSLLVIDAASERSGAARRRVGWSLRRKPGAFHVIRTNDSQLAVRYKLFSQGDERRSVREEIS